MNACRILAEKLARLSSKYKDDIKEAVRCIELAQDTVLV
jgi:hypothetical protein